MRLFTGLIHWTLIFTILFPAHVFANDSKIAQIIQSKVEEEQRLQKIANAAQLRIEATKKLLDKINSLRPELRQDAYDHLATQLLDDLAYLGQGRSVFRENTNPEESEKAKRISSVSESLEIMAMSDAKKTELQLKIVKLNHELNHQGKKLIKNNRIAMGTILTSILLSGLFGVLFHDIVSIYSRSQLTYLLPSNNTYSQLITTHHDLFAGTTFTLSLLSLVIAATIPIFRYIENVSDPENIDHNKNLQKINEKELTEQKEEATLQEEFFWKKIHAALPTLSKDPEKRIPELERMLVKKTNNPEANTLLAAVEKVRIGIEQSPCENTLTLGTDNAKAIESAKQNLEARMEEEFQADAEAELSNTIPQYLKNLNMK